MDQIKSELAAVENQIITLKARAYDLILQVIKLQKEEKLTEEKQCEPSN